MASTIAILDDHALMQGIIAQCVEQYLPGTQARQLDTDTETALRLARSAELRCTILDLDLGGDEPVDSLVGALTDSGTPVILISAAGTPAEVQAAIRAGACAYVPKHGELAQLPAALDAALDGRDVLSPELAAKLASPALDGVVLDARAQRALALHAAGMSDRSIASSMGLDTGAVHELLHSVFAAYRASA